MRGDNQVIAREPATVLDSMWCRPLASFSQEIFRYSAAAESSLYQAIAGTVLLWLGATARGHWLNRD